MGVIMGQSAVKVSVIIPSYKGSRRLLELVDAVISDPYPNKEVIVVIDKPDPKVLERLKGKSAKVIARNERKGKVSALRTAIENSTGELLLFLDDDVVPAYDNFIERVAEAMDGYDLGELRKIIVKNGLLSRMVYYDYISFNYGNHLFAKKLGRCIGFNGAAFVFWRKALEKVGGFKPVVAEDLEMGLDSYLAKLRFTYIKYPAVLNDPPRDLKDWFNQRMRWSVGAALWVKKNWRVLLRIIKENPLFTVLILFFLLPTLASMIFGLLASTELMDKVLWLLFLSASSLHSGFLILAAFMSYKFLYTLFKALIASIVSFGIFSVFFYKAAKTIDLKFNPLEFALYYFVYSPLWLTVLFTGFVRVFIFKKETVKGWVIGGSPKGE